jgi:hypothetical protein
VRPRFLPLISSVLSLVGCFNPNAPIQTKAGKLKQAEVDAIVTNCGGPAGMAKIKADKLVIYRAMAPSVGIAMCVLDALEATGETTLKMPKVGNQRYQVGSEPEGK